MCRSPACGSWRWITISWSLAATSVPLTGTLVAAGDDEVVIHRRDPQAGDLHIHFPRLGFDVVAA